LFQNTHQITYLLRIIFGNQLNDVADLPHIVLFFKLVTLLDYSIDIVLQINFEFVFNWFLNFDGLDYFLYLQVLVDEETEVKVFVILSSSSLLGDNQREQLVLANLV